MRKLSFYIITLLLSAAIYGQSPHGKSIGDRDCSLCHVSTTWKVDKAKMQFSHDETEFKLTGQGNCLIVLGSIYLLGEIKSEILSEIP